MTEQYPARIWARQFEEQQLVTFECDRSADLAFGDVVGRGYVAVGEEGDELRPQALICLSSALPAGRATALRIRLASLKSTFAA